MIGRSPDRVLEVRTDDPAAREGVPAWCRITAANLVEVVAGGAATVF